MNQLSANLDSVTALDRITRVVPQEAIAFAAGCSVVRESILRERDKVVVTPERGAMPVFWAAEGHWEVEDVIARYGHESPPIGSFYYISPDAAADSSAQLKAGTLSGEQKRRLVNDMLDRYMDDTQYVVLDEVQKGGTMSELVPIIRKRNPMLTVVAAQDSRPKIASERKKEYYTRIVSGGLNGVSTTVVPLPLIATDRAALLNQLWYSGEGTPGQDSTPEIDVIENDEAQLLFRSLGTLVRSGDFAHSPAFMSIIEGLSRNRPDDIVDQWASRVVILGRHMHEH